jgi:hypothetical protein
MLKFLERLRRRPAAAPRVVLEPDGFALLDPAGEAARVRWDEVSRVITYKRDRLTTDEIVVVFVLSQDPSHPLEVSEECSGFAELFAPLERELGVSSEWYLRTSAKPFEPDFQLIFERTPASSPGALDA